MSKASRLRTHRLLTGGATTAVMTIQADERIVSDRPVSYMRVGPGFFSTLGNADGCGP